MGHDGDKMFVPSGGRVLTAATFGQGRDARGVLEREPGRGLAKTVYAQGLSFRHRFHGSTRGRGGRARWREVCRRGLLRQALSRIYYDKNSLLPLGPVDAFFTGVAGLPYPQPLPARRVLPEN